MRGESGQNCRLIDKILLSAIILRSNILYWFYVLGLSETACEEKGVNPSRDSSTKKFRKGLAVRSVVEPKHWLHSLYELQTTFFVRWTKLLASP